MTEEVTSKLTARMVVNATHYGAAADVTQTEILLAVKEAIKELIIEDDPMLNPLVQVYIEKFSYEDNLGALRARLAAQLETLDQDQLEELAQHMREDT